ncbi:MULTISPECIES: DUF4233 domain-containing protein [Rothia]|uniref:DUF4233 domain-containing protein n=1 Tax=Rothia nasimurium TaxID=85336 RepID=A0A1Y1RQV8_9MICC|nr:MULTISPECIES: DUF4233 domain-containing protein [Rothia]ORC22123.1 hypothetical protein A7979_01050 [Rothia nasimurium]
MARMTRAQREWRPGQPKKQRSIKVMFTSMVLSLEALVAFFATLAIFGHHFNDPTWVKVLIWALGLTLVVALLATPAFLRKNWGYHLGYALQAVLILTGFALPSMFFVGAAFAVAYWYGVTSGARLDAENALRAKEQEEWEKANPA